MGLFDVHAHLTDARFDADRDQVLENAQLAGLTSIICNGLNPADNQAVAELAAGSDLVRAAFGLYPVDAVLPEMVALGIDYPREGEVCSAEEGIAWVEKHAGGAFAIGEIGLDGHWVPEELWGRQEEVFRRLVQIAMDADKAIIIHSRKRERRAFEILQEMGATRVNWHCFGSRVKLGRRIAEHGHYLSIPANVKKADSFRRMLQTLPRDRILLETDCPYLGPVRGERNEPANVAGTLEYAAELWASPREEVLAQLEDNYERLFRARP